MSFKSSRRIGGTRNLLANTELQTDIAKSKTKMFCEDFVDAFFLTALLHEMSARNEG
jgi:hypothetical protein